MSIDASKNFSPLTLRQLLASNAAAAEGDVLAVKHRLNALGHYEIPSYGMTRYPDHRLFVLKRQFYNGGGRRG